MLGVIPRVPSHLIPRSISVFDKSRNSLVQWGVGQLEEVLKIHFCPLPVCGHKYIEEIMFSGFSVGEKDLEFRYYTYTLLARIISANNIFQAQVHEGNTTEHWG